MIGPGRVRYFLTMLAHAESRGLTGTNIERNTCSVPRTAFPRAPSSFKHPATQPAVLQRRESHDRPYPRVGAMNSQGAYSLVISVTTSINAGQFAASASARATFNPAASVTFQDRTPNAFA